MILLKDHGCSNIWTLVKNEPWPIATKVKNLFLDKSDAKESPVDSYLGMASVTMLNQTVRGKEL